MVVYFALLRIEGVGAAWRKIKGILQPVILGAAFAYLINPIVNWEEKYLMKLANKIFKKEKRAKKITRFVSITGALAFVLAVIGILLKMVIPELYTSIQGLVVQLPDQVDDFIQWVNSIDTEQTGMAVYLEMALEKGWSFLLNWAETEFLPQTANLLTALTTGVFSVLKTLFNIVVGIIVTIYMLANKEIFTGQSKKIVYTVLPVKKANILIEVARKSHEIFGGFLSGKILDSAIIGLLAFICLSIMKMPYTMLVSVIVGITNVVPCFGPFIGAIPCAILILLADPLKGLYFIIFIFILQQFDGNFLGPKILGDSTGLSAFWVLFSILVFGGLWGFIGMVIGVPAFATFYYLVKRISTHLLVKKGLPTDTNTYKMLDDFDPETKEPKFMDEVKIVVSEEEKEESEEPVEETEKKE